MREPCWQSGLDAVEAVACDFMFATDERSREIVAELLVDIRALCERYGWDFDELLKRGN